MKQKKSFHMGVGVSSILMIFVVLCLTTFGTLAYVTANADLKNAEKTARASTDYYQAETQLQQLFAAIDKELLTARKDTAKAVEEEGLSALAEKSIYEKRMEAEKLLQILSGPSSVDQKMESAYKIFAEIRLSSLSNVTIQTDYEPLTVSLAIQVDDNRTIKAALQLEPYSAVKRYHLLSCRLSGNTPAGEILDEPLDLWPGPNSGNGG